MLPQNKNKIISLLIGLPIVVLFDQATKLWIKSEFVLHESRKIISNFIRFTYIHNPGGAFGTRLGNSTFYLALAIGAIIVVTIYFFTESADHKGIKVGFVLILGGAIGNLIDRIYLGKVIDFIDVGIKRIRWPTFNIADVAITIGIIFILYFTISNFNTQGHEGDEAKESNSI